MTSEMQSKHSAPLDPGCFLRWKSWSYYFCQSSCYFEGNFQGNSQSLINSRKFSFWGGALLNYSCTPIKIFYQIFKIYIPYMSKSLFVMLEHFLAVHGSSKCTAVTRGDQCKMKRTQESTYDSRKVSTCIVNWLVGPTWFLSFFSFQVNLGKPMDSICVVKKMPSEC